MTENDNRDIDYDIYIAGITDGYAGIPDSFYLDHPAYKAGYTEAFSQALTESSSAMHEYEGEF